MQMKMVVSGKQPRVCPHCGGIQIRRSKKRGTLERLAAVFFSVNPYRCKECYHRHFRTLSHGPLAAAASTGQVRERPNAL